MAGKCKSGGFQRCGMVPGALVDRPAGHDVNLRSQVTEANEDAGWKIH